jgi:hypothetical protein
LEEKKITCMYMLIPEDTDRVHSARMMPRDGVNSDTRGATTNGVALFPLSKLYRSFVGGDVRAGTLVCSIIEKHQSEIARG